MLWAHTAGIVSPVNVELASSVDALLMAVLGGSGTLVGGVIGAFIVFGLREYLSTLVPWWQYVLGAVYVLTILYLPTGLMGIPERIRQRRARTGKSRRGEENGTCDPLTCGGRSRQQRRKDHGKHLATTVWPVAVERRCWLGMATPSNAAEELRIGYVAPTTGIFAQVGKDMVDGFQMYLDDVKSDFGGPK